MKLDFSKVFEWQTYYDRAGSRDVDAKATLEMYEEARQFLESFDWCAAVVEEYVGFIYPGIVAVFLFRIQPSHREIDEWMWVIVGDLPSAYIACEECPNPATALDSYIGAMEDWVTAVLNHSGVEGKIPVNAPPTKINAEKLRARLKFLDQKILSGYAEDLKAE